MTEHQIWINWLNFHMVNAVGTFEVDMKKVMLHLDQHTLDRGVSLIQKFGMCQRHDMFPNVTAEQISKTKYLTKNKGWLLFAKTNHSSLKKQRSE